MNGLVSNQFKTDVLNDHRQFKYLVKATLTDSTVLYFGEGTGVTIEKPLMSIGWSESVSDDSSITLGNCIINKLTFSLPNFDNDFSYDLVGAKIEVSVSLDLTTNTTETFSRGTYFVKDTPVFDQSVVTVTAYDSMTAFDVLFSGVGIDFTQNPSLASIVSAIATYCSVTAVTTNVVAMNVSECEYDETTTCRQILSDIAELSGCNCRISPANQLIFTWYTNTSGVWQNQETLGGVFDLGLEREDTVITGVRVVFGKEVDANGDVLQSDWYGNSQDYMISIEDNAFVNANTYSAALANLHHLVGMTYRKGHVSHIGLPWLCAGDTAVVTDRSGTARNIIVSSTDYAANERQNTVSAGYDSAVNIPDSYTDRTRKIVDLAAILNVIGLNAEWIHTGKLIVADPNPSPEFDAGDSYSAGDYVQRSGNVYRFIRDHSGAWSGADVMNVQGTDDGRHIVMSADFQTGTVRIDTNAFALLPDGRVIIRNVEGAAIGLNVWGTTHEATLLDDTLRMTDSSDNEANYTAEDINLVDGNGAIVFRITNQMGGTNSGLTLQNKLLEEWVQNAMMKPLTFTAASDTTIVTSDLAWNGNICTVGLAVTLGSALSSGTNIGTVSHAPLNTVIGFARTSSVIVFCSINSSGTIRLTPMSGSIAAGTTIYITLTYAAPIAAPV